MKKLFILIFTTCFLTANLAFAQNEVISLRVTGALDQKDSQFCWVFSTLTIVESIFLESHPQVDPKEINLFAGTLKSQLALTKTQAKFSF